MVHRDIQDANRSGQQSLDESQAPLLIGGGASWAKW